MRAYGSAAIDIAVLDACSARMMRLSSLTFLVSRLEGDQKQLQLSGQQESLEFFAEDTAESLAQNVRDVFELPNDTKLVLYYEKLKHDPADPTEFKLISAQALVSKGRSYLESGDVSVLMVPLQDDKLELFFRAQVPAAAAPAPAAVAAAAAAAAASYSGFALTPAVASASRRDLRMSSSTGASVRHSKASVMRSKQRRKQVGVSAPGVAPSPCGKGYGKSTEQPFKKYILELITENMLRDNRGMYYLFKDQVPGNPGAQTCQVPACWQLQ